MAEPVLDQPEVLALVGECVAATVTQHVRVDVTEASPLACLCDDVVHRPANELAIALRHKQPRKMVLTSGKVAFDRPKLIASERLLSIERAFDARHPEARLPLVDLILLQAHRFAHPQTVAVHDQEQRVVSFAVPPFLGCLEQAVDF